MRSRVWSEMRQWSDPAETGVQGEALALSRKGPREPWTSWEQREARVRFMLWEDPLADACRCGVELWPLTINCAGR